MGMERTPIFQIAYEKGEHIIVVDFYRIVKMDC